MNLKGKLTVQKRTFQTVKELVSGQKAYGHFLIHSAEVKETADKKTTYLDLLLMDQTGIVSAKWWSIPANLLTAFQKQQVVYVSAMAKTYNNQIQLTIEYMAPTTDYDPLHFVPRAPEEPKHLFTELLSYVDQIEHEAIQKIVRFYLSKFQTEWQSYPAAVSMHHAVAVGLLYHTVSMLRVAERVLEVYPWLKRDLLYFGIVMHDLGKVYELEVENGIATGRTLEGQLVGHVVEGALMIERAITQLKLSISDELKSVLLHLVLSHHEKLEWGSPVTPQLPEAFMLCMIDLMDARCYAMQQALEKGVGDFTEPVKMLDTKRMYRFSFGAKERP